MNLHRLLTSAKCVSSCSVFTLVKKKNTERLMSRSQGQDSIRWRDRRLVSAFCRWRNRGVSRGQADPTAGDNSSHVGLCDLDFFAATATTPALLDHFRSKIINTSLFFTCVIEQNGRRSCIFAHPAGKIGFSVPVGLWRSDNGKNQTGNNTFMFSWRCFCLKELISDLTSLFLCTLGKCI